MNLHTLGEELSILKLRNKRVENDKAWESSLTRKIIIFVLTYIVISIFFIYAEIDKPFTNALVPALAFFLSTLSLPFFKKIWQR